MRILAIGERGVTRFPFDTRVIPMEEVTPELLREILHAPQHRPDVVIIAARPARRRSEIVALVRECSDLPIWVEILEGALRYHHDSNLYLLEPGEVAERLEMFAPHIAA